MLTEVRERERNKKNFIVIFLSLFRTLMSAASQMDSGDLNTSSLALHSIGKFCLMFFVSAIIGVVFGLVCAIVSHFFC